MELGTSGILSLVDKIGYTYVTVVIEYSGLSFTNMPLQC